MALRNEDYVAFLDESGEDRLQVVAGVLIPARWLRGAERRWRDFIRNHLGSRSGLTEIKSRDLLKGTGVSIHAQRRILASGGAALSATAAGRQFYGDALEHIAGIAELRVIAVGLPTNRPIEVYRLWFWMAYAALIQRARPPRPRLPMVFIDGEDHAFRNAQDLVAHRFYGRFWGQRPYLTRGPEWLIGGSAHQDSVLHPFIQMADLVAGAARHSIARRLPQGAWYQDHLRDIAASRRPPRKIDASSHALQALRELDPADAAGSNWPEARLPS
jgi:hypothetical protein